MAQDYKSKSVRSQLTSRAFFLVVAIVVVEFICFALFRTPKIMLLVSAFILALGFPFAIYFANATIMPLAGVIGAGRRIAEDLMGVNRRVGSSTEHSADQASTVSSAAEQVSKSIQTVASSVEEMSGSILEISRNANEAAKVATQAVQVAESTNSTIAKLGDSSTEIGNVVKVITSIAEQTNLLALNATIEAARAGEAGKGFAVVANEVKELAKGTAKATEDISHKVEKIQDDARGAIAAIGEISKIINRIADIQNTIASAVEEQTATTKEMGRSIAEAAKGATEIAKGVADVAKTTQDITGGIKEVQKATEEMSQMTQDLQSLLDRGGAT